jgi:hypothetical protein
MKLGSRLQRIVAAVSVTALTLAIIGVVLVASTPLGCGPAKALHLKLSPSRCANVASINPSPSPFPNGIPSPSPFPAQSASPFPEPTSTPFPEPASNPFPDNSSGVFPPFAPAASTGSGQGPGLALNCRLPMFAGGPGSGGFVVFPSGGFIADPRSAVSVPSPSPGTASPLPQYGYGYQGWFGTTYDQAYSRWLPVPYRWVSPDGTRYAYPGQPDGIYIQNVANGTQVEVGEGKSWQILDVDATAVYAVTGATGGLWRLPFSGTVTQVTSSGYWQALSPNGFAYGTATSNVPNGAGNTILQLNLATGASIEYFTATSRQSSVAGFDFGGNPIIYVQAQPAMQIWIGIGAGRANPIADLSYTNFYPNGSPISDRHGIWLAGGNAIALYVQGGGWYLMSSIGGQLAGGCN